MITKEDVADLRPGDVVELTDESWQGATVRGTVYAEGSDLMVGPHLLRQWNSLPYSGNRRSLTVVSRAPRPIYVNHDRSHPVPGDVARDDETDARVRVWSWTEEGWQSVWMHKLYGPSKPQCHLRLLVDGETGQIVDQ